jgi:putative thioredoxin
VRPQQSPWAYDVNEKTFAQDVLDRSKDVPVVVDFWAPWCGPCRALGPLLERLVAERDGQVVLAKVNIDECPNLAAQFGVRAVPTVVALRQGKVVLDFEGQLPEPQLRQFLDQIGPTEAETLASQAASQEKTDPAKAEEAYRKALADDPRNEAAQVGLARVLVQLGKDDEARQVLAEAPSTGEVGAEAERLNAVLGLRGLARDLGSEQDARKRLEADPKNARLKYELGCVLAAAGKYQEALDLLLAAGEADVKLAPGKVREAMVQVFQLLGPQSPVANDYRNRLSALLY